MSETIETIKTLGTMIVNLQKDEELREKWWGEFTDHVKELDSRHKELKAAAKSNAAAAQNMNAIAKGIPAFSKGVMSAVQGFQKNDPLAGSAGVIDAVSSIITTVASMSSAAGPPGAIIGAILSVVSMILKLFSAQKPTKSMAQQLMEVIRKYDAEKTIQHLKTVQELIEDFMHTTSPKNFQTFPTYRGAMDYYNDLVPDARERIMDATQWLKQRQNKELELWSAVLAAQCFAYIAYAQSMIVVMSLIKVNEEKELFRKRYFPVMSQLQLDFLKEILPTVRNKGTVWYCTFDGYLLKRGIVVSHEEVKAKWVDCGAARGWGSTMDAFTVAHRPTRANQVATSPYPSLAQFSVESGSPRIQNLPFVANGTLKISGFADNYIFRGRFGQAPFKEKYGIALRQVVGDTAKKWRELPPTYGVFAQAGKHSHEVLVYTTHGSQLRFWEHGKEKHAEHETEDLRHVGTFGVKDGFLMGQVTATFPRENPNETGTPDFFNGSAMSAVYGACAVAAGKSDLVNYQINISAAHMEIIGYFMDHRYPNNPFRPFQQGRFTSPWPFFLGITSDPHYVWVYRAGAIACATHNDILTCLQSGKSAPDWMVYHIPHKGISDRPYDPEEPGIIGNVRIPRGLLALDACRDGSLTAVFSDDYVYIENPVRSNIYAMTHKIDLEARTLQIVKGSKKDELGHIIPTPGWEKDDTAVKPYRVVKQPVYCWEVVDALISSLEETVTVAE